MRWIAIAVTLLTLAFVGAGCGGGSDEASTDTETIVATDTTGTDETSTDETSTDETSTDETSTDTDISGGFASGDCLELINASAALSQAFAAGGSGDLSGQTEKLQELVDAAPEEIRDDVGVLAKFYASYAEALADIDLAPGETPSAEDALKLSQALSTLDQPEVTAASERLGLWAQENCPSG